MGNLKTLRGLLVCIAFLERTSTNRVNAQCQDRQYCVQYKFPLVCEGIGKEWYLKNCPKSCKACPADHLSKTYVDTSTATLVSSKSTIREERNVTDVNKVSVTRERTTGTTRILSATGGAATCLDKAECSKFRKPLDCTRDPWFRQNCQASCNTCPRGTSKTTRTSTREVSSQPRRTTALKRVASVTASSHPQRTVVTTWIPSPAAESRACRDDNACTRFYDFHRLCSGTNEWYRQHCRLSCNMCTTDQVSVTREISQTITTSPVRSRNVSVQVHDDVTWSHPQRTVVTTWIPSPAASSGACKDDNACTNYKDFHHLCSGTDGWYRKHCRLSCNMCNSDQVSVTREISQTITTIPVKARNVSVQVHDDVSQATSPVRSRNVSVQVHDDVSLGFPESASHLPSPHQNVIIAVVIIAVIVLIVFIAGVMFKKRRDKSLRKNPLQPMHEETWSSDGQVVFTNAYEQIALISHDQQDQSSDQNHAIDINPPTQAAEEREVHDTCTVSVNNDGLIYSILDFKDFQPKDFVPPSPTERTEYATIDFGGAISCTKNT